MRQAIALLLVLLLPSLAASAAPNENTWLSVLLDGRKIGSMHTTRQVHGALVVTSQSMRVQINRAGVTVALGTSETDTETRDGKPLGFVSRTTISGIESVVSGKRRKDGRFDIVSEVGGTRNKRVIDWPDGALLSEGLRLAERHAGLKAGTKLHQLAFQADSLNAVAVDSTVAARERVDLPGGNRMLTRIDQVIHLPGAPTNSVVWIDAEQNVQKLSLPLMGYKLTMLACSRACAEAPNQPADILGQSMAPSPNALSADELQHGLVLDISAGDGGALPHFAQTDEQRVRTLAKHVQLRITPLNAHAPGGRERAPSAADSRANDWLQSNDPLIRKLARKGAGDATTVHDKMQHLQEFVRGYISSKNLSVGYASALEVARNPEGDCTEHAVLLAALGRALGIPTRVVDGLAYTERYAGKDHVFVPHAWTQAWVDGHWQSFDAALPGFDAGHIALSYGDGDPWRFFAGMNALGRMRIDKVGALSAQAGASNPAPPHGSAAAAVQRN